MKRYIFGHKDELEELQKYRDYCEKRAMRVLNGTLHLHINIGEPIQDDVQKKKDYFLYKYYEYQFDWADKTINNICAYEKK